MQLSQVLAARHSKKNITSLKKQSKASQLIKTTFYFNTAIKMVKFTAGEPKREETSARTEHLWSDKPQNQLARTLHRSPFSFLAQGCWTTATARLSSSPPSPALRCLSILLCSERSKAKRPLCEVWHAGEPGRFSREYCRDGSCLAEPSVRRDHQIAV